MLHIRIKIIIKKKTRYLKTAYKKIHLTNNDWIDIFIFVDIYTNIFIQIYTTYL